MKNMENGYKEAAAVNSKSKSLRRTKDSICTGISSQSVSARLNPEFNPIKNLIQNHTASNTAEELDPMTMDFDSLAKILHPTFIYNYLHQILQFMMDDDEKEVSFPSLAPYKKAFLVKIAQKHSYLTSPALEENSLKVGKRILEIMEKKRNVFRLKHAYRDLSENVLVYKKTSTIQDDIEESSSTSKALVTSLKDMSLSQERQEIIPSSFKTTMLNTTLRFIKDPTRLTLIYPEMSLQRAQFLYSLIYPPNENESDVGLGFKSIYSSLFDAIKSLRGKYDFQVSFHSTQDISTTQLSLKKIPVHNDVDDRRKAVVNNNSTDLNSSNASNSTSSSGKHTSGKQRIVQSLPEKFLRSSLETLLDFIEDKHQASVDFKDITVRESQFLECVTSMTRTEKYYKLFSAECEVLLKRIGRALRRHEWSLHVSVGKLCRRTQLRTIIFSKSSIFESDKKVDIKSNGLSTTSERNSTTDSRVRHISVRKDFTSDDRQVSILDNSDSRKVKSDNKEHKSDSKNGASDKVIENWRDHCVGSERQNSGRDRVSDSVAKSSDNKDKRSRKYHSIEFESAGCRDLSQGLHEEGERDGRSRVASVPRPPAASRRGRLMKAFATPLESDRAERMMRMMGWEGGALGPRGEGITEPIVPAIHLAPGAGLGHVKQTNHPQSATEFRTKLLQDILSFVQSESTETCISFPQPLTKREGRFIKPTIEAFNDRKRIGLSSSEEMSLVRKIGDEMLADLQLQLRFQVTEDKRKLHLHKEKGPLTQRMSRKKRNKLKSERLTSSKDVIHVNDLANDIESFCLTRKAAKYLAYRIKFLEKIKDFLTKKKELCEYSFDCVLNTKQKRYIEDVIYDVNRRSSTRNKSSEIENDLYRDIRKLASGSYLSVSFSRQKFTLKGKYSRKSSTSCIQDLPPPKSKDVKSTIIYHNNFAIPAEKYNGTVKNDTKRHKDKSHNSENNKVKNPKHSKDENCSDDDILDITDNVDLSDSDKTPPIDKTNDKEFQLQDSIDTDLDITNNSVSLNDKTIDREFQIDDFNDTDLDITNNSVNLNDKGNDKEFQLDDSTTDLDITKDSVSLNISNDSLMLDVLERSNNSISTLPDSDTIDVKAKLKASLSKEVNNNYDIIKNKNDSKTNRKHDTADDINTASDSYQSSNKRILPLTDHETPKKNKYMKYVSILHKYTIDISVETVKLAQKLISDAIDENNFMPLLKCHGIQNGGLLYSCHCARSYDWLKNVISVASDLKIIDTDFCEHIFKLSMKINSFLKEDAKTVFSRLEMYNPGLSTKSWVIIEEEYNEKFILLKVNLDEKSYKYISENDFSLFVGIDKAQFSILWH